MEVAEVFTAQAGDFMGMEDSTEAAGSPVAGFTLEAASMVAARFEVDPALPEELFAGAIMAVGAGTGTVGEAGVGEAGVVGAGVGA